ncbi:MAG TPA: hypothetical protein VFK35_04320 [Candidatus Limnocylindrales bacterium]|nr:hypothetical protein [Candidatus Limnocylindrales bacterium]
MASRDRPKKEAKKKPKDKSGLPKLTSLSEPPPQQAELIRKPRKEKPVREVEDTDEG